MTKALSNTYRERLLDSTAPDLTAVDIKIVALDATYVFSAAHNFLDDISGGAIVATTGNLASKTKTDGYFDAANPNLGSPTAGDTITQLWSYHDTGTPATSLLLSYTDENAAGGSISILTDGDVINLNLFASGLFRV